MSPNGRAKVPAREQWLAAGAALGNLVNAAHQLDLSANVLSGERRYDKVLSQELRLQRDGWLVGFMSVGTIRDTPPSRNTVMPGPVWVVLERRVCLSRLLMATLR